MADPPLIGWSFDASTAGVDGECWPWPGLSRGPDSSAVGVLGQSTGIGVWGITVSGRGVMGTDFGNGTGVVGNSKEGNGIYGTTPNSGMSGVIGENTDGGTGVYGTSVSGNAVAGKSQTGNAGWFEAAAGAGVYATSSGYDGVHGESSSGETPGIAGRNTHQGTGVYGYSSGVGNAGKFDGNVRLNGTLTVTEDIAPRRPRLRGGVRRGQPGRSRGGDGHGPGRRSGSVPFSRSPTTGGSPGWSPAAASTSPRYSSARAVLRGTEARSRLWGRCAAKRTPSPSRSTWGTC